MSTKHRRKPYMPDSDSGKRTWMERFLAQIETDPEHYGFDDPRMFEYTQRTIREFITASKATEHKPGRSHLAVTTKNEARKRAVRMCRDIAMRLKFDPTISLEELRALGIRTDEAPPEDAKLPQGAVRGTAGYPSLNVQNSPNGGHVISWFDWTSKSKAKPKGVSHLLLFAAIGEKPHMRHTHARLLGCYTKRPFEIMYPVGCGIEGLYVTYYGRWLTTRGEMSPWSPGVSKMIGDTQVSLRDSDFGHIFSKEGFIDALPEGRSEDRLMLEGGAGEGDALFAALEAKMDAGMDARMLPWRAFALLEAEMTSRGEDGS